MKTIINIKLGGKNMKSVIFQFRFGKIIAGLVSVLIVLLTINVSAQFSFNRDLEINFIGIMETKSIKNLKDSSDKKDKDLVATTECTLIKKELFTGYEGAMQFEEWMIRDNFGQSVFNLEYITEAVEDEMVIEDWMLEDFWMVKEPVLKENIGELVFEDWMVDESYWVSGN